MSQNPAQGGKPRILLVSATPFFGGGEVYYVKLAKLLKDQFELFAVAFNPKLQDELETLGVRVFRGSPETVLPLRGRYLSTAQAMLRAILSARPALVHLNGGPEVFLSLIPRLCFTPVLITYHTFTPEATPRFKRFILKICLNRAVKIVCVSNTVRENMRTVLGVRNTTVIPNWISEFPGQVKMKHYDGLRPLKLLFVGRLVKGKGIFDLAKAMRSLNNVHLDVVGDGPCREEMERECAGLPVTFHGFQNDPSRFYEEADLLVFPSYPDFEGLPLVLLEAMSYGLPCLVSDIDAALETTGNGTCAEVFHCGDASEMAKKICDLQVSHNRQLRLRKAGRDLALQKYNQSTAKDRYNLLISALIGTETRSFFKGDK